LTSPVAPGGHVVLLVENESVPTDKRVWNEGQILRQAGYSVTIVCPIGADGRDPETSIELEGISIRRFPLDRATGGVKEYLREYAQALLRMSAIVWRINGPIKAIHVANPPDFLFLVSLVPKLRWGTKLIFDHHDLTPELFTTRFGSSGLVGRIVRAVERINFKVADAVVSTNESYRTIALGRGGKRPEQVRVVRNARELETFTRVQPDASLKRGRKHLAVYVGVMGHQDGADCAVRAAAHYRHDLGRNDLQVAFVGDGDALDDCVDLARDLDVADMIDFAGWQTTENVLRYLSTADVGLATDPPNALNDHSTMIKVIEYLAVGLPVVSFDLSESIVTAGDAALYAANGDCLELARNLATLIDDAELRADLGERGLERSRGPLSWATARNELLATYEFLLGA
jgi:glycosyltransferase involved in cell wall biosynthesis